MTPIHGPFVRLAAAAAMMCEPVYLEPIDRIADQLTKTFRSGGKLIVFGCGGSAALAGHMAAELVGRFETPGRRPLPAIALTEPATVTALFNDFQHHQMFQRQVEAYASRGDIVLGISTSGLSPSVLTALGAALDFGAVPFLLTGEQPDRVPNVDLVRVPGGGNTALTQELHLAVIHHIVRVVENNLRQTQNSS